MSNNYYTPVVYINAVREVMGSIELDPTSSTLANQTVNADRIFTIANSMFRNSLKAKTVFFNPPYSNPLEFCRRLVDAVENNEVKEVIGVLNLDCSTRWWREIEKIADCYCFLYDRIQFLKANDLETEAVLKKGNDKPQFFFYAGENVDSFVNVFSKFGTCLKYNN